MNGICNSEKRRNVFLHAAALQNNRLDILVLVSTKLNHNLHQQIKNERGGEHFFNTIDGARGILVWINNDTKPIIAKEVHKDNAGNLLIIEIKYDNEIFKLVSLYGPSEADRPMFFENMFDQITMDDNASKFIIVGDWNVTLNYELDNYNYIEDRYPNSRVVINKVKDDWGLVDPVEFFEVERPHMTYKSWGINGQTSRLDFFLLSPTMVSSTKNYGKGDTIGLIDHEPIYLKIDFSSFGKSQKTWRFPDKYLCNSDFRQLIRKSIRRVVLRYEISRFGVNLETEAGDYFVNDFLVNEPSERLYERRFSISYHELYEVTMNEIRVDAIAYTAGQKNVEREALQKKLRALVKESQKLEKHVKIRMINGRQIRTYNQIIQANVNRLKRDYELQLKRVGELDDAKKGIFGKIHGEQPRPGFGVLKKNKVAQKYIPALRHNLGPEDPVMLHTNKKNIETILHNEFKKLYSKHNTEIGIDDFISDDLIPKIPGYLGQELEADITIDEVTKVLNKTKVISSPGWDGFSYNCLKEFWGDLKFLFIKVIHESFTKESLPPSQKWGNISLIPKGDKDKLELKNWRPLTLLPAFYKLVSGSLAKRMSKTLPYIIKADQQGFVSGRNISECLRTTIDLIEYVNRNRVETLMVCIDFKKAFDSLDHGFILDVLKKFGFGPNFVRWVNLLLKEFNMRVLNGGTPGDHFASERGARQGDPISSLLFILCIEILCIKLRSDPSVKGVSLNGQLDVLISIFADDIVVFLQYDEDNLRNTLRIFEEFGKLSGLKIQVEKSQISYLGGNYDNSKKLCRDMDFVWSKNINLLGLNFNASLTNLYDNVKDKKLGFYQDLDNWDYKFLTPMGRISALKSYILPKFNHVSMVIPILKNNDITEIESRMYKFIWRDQEKGIISRDIAKAPLKDGGINAPDLEIMFKSYSLTWLRKLANFKTYDRGWYKILNVLLAETTLRIGISDIWNLKSGQFSELQAQVKSNFWSQIFGLIPELLKSIIHTRKFEFLNERIWDSEILDVTNRNWASYLRELCNEGNDLKLEKLRVLMSLEPIVINNLKTVVENLDARSFRPITNIIPAPKTTCRENFPEIYNGIEFISDFYIYDATTKSIRFKNAEELFEMRPFQYWEEDMRELKKTIGIFLLLYDINETDFKVESLTLPKTPIALNIAKISEKGCSKWAQLLKGKNDSKIQKENRIREAKLNDALGINLETRDWKKIYNSLGTISFDFKYRYFQYRINRGLLETNSRNRKVPSRVHDIMCNFCNSNVETLRHLLWDCNITKDFYNEMKTVLIAIWPDFIWINDLKWVFFGEIGRTHNNSQRIIVLFILRYLYMRKAFKQRPTVLGCKNYLHNLLFTLQKAGEVKSTAMNLAFFSKAEFANIYRKFDIIRD